MAVIWYKRKTAREILPMEMIVSDKVVEFGLDLTNALGEKVDVGFDSDDRKIIIKSSTLGERRISKKGGNIGYMNMSTRFKAFLQKNNILNGKYIFGYDSENDWYISI